MMALHTTLATGRWNTLSLMEQLGNTGSEVGRALRAREARNTSRLNAALDRALELLDLTIADPKNRTRLRELCRLREVVCDFFYGDNLYKSTQETMDRYFLHFGVAARNA